jgi:hypothetical protein
MTITTCTRCGAAVTVNARGTLVSVYRDRGNWAIVPSHVNNVCDNGLARTHRV